MTPLTQRALDIAVSQIGTKELGRNRGLKVEAYQASVGLPAGSPWCYAYCYWVFERAAEELAICPVDRLPRTGGVHKAFSRARKLHLDTQLPTVGAVFCHDAGGGMGHAGVVESVDHESQTIGTIEGNTSETGSREGNAVARKVRPFGYVNLGFIVVGQ